MLILFLINVILLNDFLAVWFQAMMDVDEIYRKPLGKHQKVLSPCFVVVFLFFSFLLLLLLVYCAV